MNPFDLEGADAAVTDDAASVASSHRSVLDIDRKLAEVNDATDARGVTRLRCSHAHPWPLSPRPWSRPSALSLIACDCPATRPQLARQRGDHVSARQTDAHSVAAKAPSMPPMTPIAEERPDKGAGERSCMAYSLLSTIKTCAAVIG